MKLNIPLYFRMINEKRLQENKIGASWVLGFEIRIKNYHRIFYYPINNMREDTKQYYKLRKKKKPINELAKRIRDKYKQVILKLGNK